MLLVTSTTVTTPRPRHVAVAGPVVAEDDRWALVIRLAAADGIRVDPSLSRVSGSAVNAGIETHKTLLRSEPTQGRRSGTRVSRYRVRAGLQSHRLFIGNDRESPGLGEV